MGGDRSLSIVRSGLMMIMKCVIGISKNKNRGKNDKRDKTATLEQTACDSGVEVNSGKSNSFSLTCIKHYNSRKITLNLKVYTRQRRMRHIPVSSGKK